jgi:DNA-binding GntR family transcriptional regulator
MSTFVFKPQSNISLREKVTNDLREAILNGSLKPGHRIKEMDIAEQMGVSRGPVREAIRHLEREGILLSHPYKETVVADLSAEEVNEVLIPIRYHLECFVVRKYLDTFDDSKFGEFQQIVDAMSHAAANRMRKELVELDIAFHQALLELAKERTVILTWKSILHQIQLHIIKNLANMQLDTLPQDHQRLLDIFKTKNMESIQEELFRHIQGDTSLH